MGRLVGPRPQVDQPSTREAAFEVERLVVARPCPDCEVDALPEPLDRLRRIGIGREDFVGHAAHEADVEPSAGDAIDHGHLFGDAQRIAAVRHRIAENADAALSGLARQDGRGQRRGDVEARRGLVMLVDHMMEAEIIGDHVFVEISVVEVGPDLRIVMPARQRHPHRAQRVDGRQMRVGHLGKMPNVHSGSSGNDPARA